MPATPPGPIRLLPHPGAREQVLPDLPALLALARQGQVSAAARVKIGGEPWVEAAAIPALAAALDRDPWAAWEDEEQAAPAAPPAPDIFAQGGEESTALHELPVHAIAPVSEPAKGPRLVVHSKNPRPAAIPAEVAPSGPAAPPSPRAPIPLPRRPAEPRPIEAIQPLDLPDEGGQIIAFPQRSTPTIGATALQPLDLPELSRRPSLDDEARAAVPQTRWGRLIAFAFLLLGLLLMMRWWVRATATQTFPKPEAAVAAAPLEAAPVPEAADVYDALEAELRAMMPTEVRDIKQAGELEAALIVELSRMKVVASRVEAPVLDWEGRKNDVPKVAELHIWINSKPGELDRELASIGLVVGKYINTYTLEVPVFEVTFEGLGETPLRRTLDPQGARYFYRRNLSLYDFLLGRTPDPTHTRPPGK